MSTFNGYTTDLILAIKNMQKDCHLSVANIGQLYIAVVRALPKEFLPSFYVLQNERAQRDRKKLFERRVTNRFLFVKNRISIDLYDIQNAIGEQMSDNGIEIPVGTSSIEGIVERLISLGHQSQIEAVNETIGSAVIRGAEIYYNEKPEEYRNVPYKTFLEYNRILTQLQNINTPKTNQ